MTSRRRLAALLTTLAVGAAPAAALAQSGAGDDQYVDPIGGGSGQTQGSGGSGSSGSSGGSSNGPALSTAPSLSATQAQAAPSAAPAAAGATGQTLPRTGLNAGAVAAIGLALLLSGLALRARLADDRL